ncbi:hypothetical protein [Salinibacter ruber]|uniref:hypothetical protein n=1 Tax=Salinibacter ruber TaxID=146919 RepID=UPI00207402EC|nr:hypothetical protein [Salinibacter ruber]MCS4114909.1 hypothetical protein [Salinibacter ruber]
MFRWHDFASGDRFREGARALLEAVRSTEASKLLVDAQNMTAHDKADQRWLGNEWMPKVIEAGIEHSVTVHEANPFAEAEMKALLSRLDGHDVSSIMTSDMEKARAWIADK